MDFDIDKEIRDLNALITAKQEEAERAKEMATKLRGRMEFLLALKQSGYTIVKEAVNGKNTE